MGLATSCFLTNDFTSSSTIGDPLRLRSSRVGLRALSEAIGSDFNCTFPLVGERDRGSFSRPCLALPESSAISLLRFLHFAIDFTLVEHFLTATATGLRVFVPWLD